MADTWWHEETKVHINLWIEEEVPNQFNTMHNRKLVWYKIYQRMTEGGWVYKKCTMFSAVLKLTTRSKNIAIFTGSFTTVTKYLVTSDKSGRCFN